MSSRPLPFESCRRVAQAVGALALYVACAAAAWAEPADGPAAGPSRELWLEGKQFWERGDYAHAADRFDRAYEVEHTPSLGLWVARSLARSGRLVAAAARYGELSQQSLPSDASAKDWAAKRDAQNERQELLLRIPSVVVAIDGANKEAVAIAINDQVLPLSSIGLRRFVDPGPVRVRGTSGGRSVEAKVELAEGETKTVRLVFRAPLTTGVGAPEHPGDARRLVSYVAMGVGGAALLTGSVFGFLSLDDEARLRGQCPDSRCPDHLSPDVEAYESRKTIATVSLLSGAALTATGIVLYLTAARKPDSAQTGLVFTGHGARLWGEF